LDTTLPVTQPQTNSNTTNKGNTTPPTSNTAFKQVHSLKRRRQDLTNHGFVAKTPSNSMDISSLINTVGSSQDQQMVQLPATLLQNLLQRLETLETIISSNPQLVKNQKQQKNNNNNNNKSNTGVTETPQFSFNLDKLRPTVKEHEKRVPLGTTNDSQWADLFKQNNTTNNNNKKQKNTENLQKATNKKNKKPENKNKKYFSNTKVGLERAHRAFTEPSTTPSSYEFIHIPCNRRINKQDARALIHQLGVQQSRVIDIQFPARNTVSFFVHSEFAPKFRELLTKHQFKEKEKFDFFDETILANPAFATLDQKDKQQLTRDIYTKRMVRLCTETLVAKPFLAKSIARFLANTDTTLNIPASNFGELFKSNITKVTNIRSSPNITDDSQNMEI
jgi:hypothetical protein